MTIHGANLGNNPQVTVLDNASNPDPQITAAIVTATATNASMDVSLTISGSAGLGDRRVRVRTDGGTVTTTSAGSTVVTVLPPAPTITGIAPTGGRQTVSVVATINGTNLGGGTAVAVLLNDGVTVDANTTVALGALGAGGTSQQVTLNIGAAAAAG